MSALAYSILAYFTTSRDRMRAEGLEDSAEYTLFLYINGYEVR